MHILGFIPKGFDTFILRCQSCRPDIENYSAQLVKSDNMESLCGMRGDVVISCRDFTDVEIEQVLKPWLAADGFNKRRKEEFVNQKYKLT